MSDQDQQQEEELPAVAVERAKFLEPYFERLEEARDKVAKVQEQVAGRIRRGILTREQATVIVEDARMSVERAAERFDGAMKKWNRGRK